MTPAACAIVAPAVRRMLLGLVLTAISSTGLAAGTAAAASDAAEAWPAASPSTAQPAARPSSARTVDVGERPLELVRAMQDGELKERLARCAAGPFRPSDFSIGHRGAPLRYPEHTEESYRAAARQGAGIVECDVTFTKDRRLVCRHSQCDLHSTTDILQTPLAARCQQPFTPADPRTGTAASARCCTSDLTLAEFETLRGRHDRVDPSATTLAAYLDDGPEDERAIRSGTLLSHARSVALFRALGVKVAPELKAPEVPMPFDGDWTRERYADALIDELRAGGLTPDDVWLQSFDLADLRHWLAHAPEWGARAVLLDGRYAASPPLDPNDPASFEPSMSALAAEGIRVLAPPIWMLLRLDDDGRIVPSAYAKAAREAGLDLIAWTLERSGSLVDGGGFYYQSVAPAIDGEGDVFEVLHVLAQEVGVIGVFSDWPATTTWYASCFDL